MALAAVAPRLAAPRVTTSRAPAREAHSLAAPGVVVFGSSLRGRGAKTTDDRSSVSTASDAKDSELVLDAGDAAGEEVEQEVEQETSTTQFGSNSFMRKISIASMDEAIDLLDAELESAGRGGEALEAEEADALLTAALERGNNKLALDIYDAMCCTGGRDSPGPGSTGSWLWPAASLDSVCIIVEGLARALRVEDALQVVARVMQRGLPSASQEVSFGRIVNCPLVPEQPLAVVRPSEGSAVVACARTRYEFELFSGNVVSVQSQALEVSGNPLVAAARSLGLWRGPPPPAAIHEVMVAAPDGLKKTFRCATGTKDVPAGEGERITVVLSPDANAPMNTRRLISTRPPNTRPGEALTILNHATGTEIPLLRPPPPGVSGPPGWAVPVAILLAGGDAASGLIDPTLPTLIAGGLLLTASSAAATSQYVYPELKRLPEKAVAKETVRQTLLKDHNVLQAKVAELTAEANALVRDLARLAQLQAKMDAVGGEGEYAARMARVGEAAAAASGQLRSALQLLDGYATVMKRIEIEVDMDVAIAAGEVDMIAEQIEALTEVESLQAEWKLAAEARDEVEKLLRAP